MEFTPIGELIRARRRALDWTQAELGTALGVSGKVVHLTETSQQRLRVDDLHRWAAALGQTALELLGSKLLSV